MKVTSEGQAAKLQNDWIYSQGMGGPCKQKAEAQKAQGASAQTQEPRTDGAWQLGDTRVAGVEQSSRPRRDCTLR